MYSVNLIKNAKLIFSTFSKVIPNIVPQTMYGLCKYIVCIYINYAIVSKKVLKYKHYIITKKINKNLLGTVLKIKSLNKKIIKTKAQTKCKPVPHYNNPYLVTFYALIEYNYLFYM